MGWAADDGGSVGGSMDGGSGGGRGGRGRGGRVVEWQAARLPTTRRVWFDVKFSLDLRCWLSSAIRTTPPPPQAHGRPPSVAKQLYNRSQKKEEKL